MPVTQERRNDRKILSFSQSPDLDRIQLLTNKLDESEIQLETFFRLSSDLLAISDKTHFRRLNPKWVEVLGWSLEELYKYPHEHFLHPDDVARTEEAIERLQVGPLGRFVNRLRAKDGTYHYLEWTASKLQDGLTYAVARDITEICKECPQRYGECAVLGFTENKTDGG